VVLIILEDIGLYPVLTGKSVNYSWELSEEEKNIPPSNYNSLRFLIYCIESENDDFFNLKTNQFFSDKLHSYGRNYPFPTSFTEFAAADFRKSIKEWFLNVSIYQDNYHNFFDYLLRGVSAKDVSKATMSTSERDDSVVSTGHRKRQQIEESDYEKKRAKSSRPTNTTTLKSDHDIEQIFHLKALGKASKGKPCQVCHGENKQTDAVALVIDEQKQQETCYCKFHATEWYATHESLTGCKIIIPMNNTYLTYRHYNYISSMKFR
jgi:hypothetical protein